MFYCSISNDLCTCNKTFFTFYCSIRSMCSIVLCVRLSYTFYRSIRSTILYVLLFYTFYCSICSMRSMQFFFECVLTLSHFIDIPTNSLAYLVSLWLIQLFSNTDFTSTLVAIEFLWLSPNFTCFQCD